MPQEEALLKRLRSSVEELLLSTLENYHLLSSQEPSGLLQAGSKRAELPPLALKAAIRLFGTTARREIWQCRQVLHWHLHPDMHVCTEPAVLQGEAADIRASPKARSLAGIADGLLCPLLPQRRCATS